MSKYNKDLGGFLPRLTRANYITLAAVGLLCLTLGLWLVVERMRGEPVEVLPVEVVGEAHGPIERLCWPERGCTNLGPLLPRVDSVRERVIGR